MVCGDGSPDRFGVSVFSVLAGVLLSAWRMSSYQPLIELPKAAKVCRKCRNKGLIRVRYRDKAPDAYAVCDCWAGKWYRRAGDAMTRLTNPWMPATAILAWLEDFPPDNEPAVKSEREQAIEWARR